MHSQLTLTVLGFIVGAAACVGFYSDALAGQVDCNLYLTCNNPYPCPPYTCCQSVSMFGCVSSTCSCGGSSCPQTANGTACRCTLGQMAPCVLCAVQDGQGGIASYTCDPYTCVPGHCVYEWDPYPEFTCFCQ